MKTTADEEVQVYPHVDPSKTVGMPILLNMFVCCLG